jgi:hexosaminidase
VKYSYNINDFALNPCIDATYDTITAILSDIVKATGAAALHTGGDEVVYGCWANDSSIVKYMSDNNIKSYDQLLGVFVNRVDGIVSSLGAVPMHWEEVFKAGVVVDPSTIFQVWTDASSIASITAANYSTIASTSSYWYLDHSVNTWQVMYTYDPAVNLTTTQQLDRLIGGEVTMWGEFVDETNLEQMIWPRANAVSERLWSPSTVVDTVDANARLLVQRCRMVKRGVKSAPVQPDGYCDQTYI